MGKKGGKKRPKDDKEKKKRVRKPTQIWKAYKVNGQKLDRNNKSCPKCGPGNFMANHKNRSSCGRCGYTEFNK